MIETPLSNVSSRLDWERIEAWSQQLVEDDLRQITAVFEANAAILPRLLWLPRRDQVQTAQLRFLLDYWSNLSRRAAVPRIDQVDLEQLAPIHGHVGMIDVVEDGRDFRRRHYSATIAALPGYRMSGEMISELSAPPYVAEFAVAQFRAAYRRGDPLYIERTGSGSLYNWDLLILPFADGTGKIAVFVVGAVPFGAGGLPITLDF